MDMEGKKVGFMPVCRICGNQTTEGASFCGMCGAPVREVGRSTVRLNEDVFKEIAMRSKQRRAPEQAAPVRKGLMRLELVELGHAIVIPVKEKIILGRPDPVTNIKPDVDFTSLAGYRMGVSRRHAEIHWYHDNVLNLYDMGSSNGTFLNSERLGINQAYPIYNADEIRLGQLSIYVYYEIQADDTFIPFRERQD
jgi:hypothetical protein